MGNSYLTDYFSLNKVENILRSQYDQSYLNELIKHNEDLIWFTYHKYLSKLSYLIQNNIDNDDILQVGRIALLKAIMHYDVSKHYKFSTFAVIIIQREIRTFIYNHTGVLKIPRSVRKNKTIINQIQETSGTLPPTDKISKKLNISENQVRKIIQIDQTPIYLNEDVDGESKLFINTHEIIGDTEEDLFYQVFIDSILEKLADILTPLELKIIRLKVAGYKQIEIAKKLNISAIKVSRTIKKAMPYIKKLLKDD